MEIIDLDWLTIDEGLIGHQVNCQGKMGAGLALKVRRKYPGVYQQYLGQCQSVQDKSRLLGLTQFVTVDEALTVVNIFGQLRYGRGQINTSIDALKEAATAWQLNGWNGDRV